MPLLPLFGRGVKAKSSNVIAQRRVNLYTERPSDSDKSDVVLYSRPGLYPNYFTSNGAGYGGGPIRGLAVAQRIVSPGTSAQQLIVDVVYAAIADKSVVSVNNPGGFDYITDAFQTTTGPMIYADDGAVILSVDGISAYVGDYSAGGTAQTDIATTVPNFPFGATSICSLASRFIANDPSNKGRFWWSAPLDYTSWNGTDFATAESFPDPLEAVYSYRGELILFGTSSMEFWAPTSDGFARTGGSGAAWGLVSQETLCDVDGQLFFLARNAGSDAKVVALNGYQPQAVSDPDVEYEINKNLTGPISATVIRKAGNTFYVLRLGTKTWAFNATSGEWDEWQTGSDNFVGRFAFFAYGRQSVTSAVNAEVYGVDADSYVDGTVDMVRELQTRHVFHDMDRLTVHELRLDAETGVSTHDGVDAQVMLQISRDGGHTWGNELWQSLGRLGDYGKPLVWTRLGRARDFVFRFRVSDPVKVVFIGVSLRIG
jgi:hypothetical protein